MTSPETRTVHNTDQLIEPAAAEQKRLAGALFIDVRQPRPDRPKGDIEGAVKVDKKQADALLDPSSADRLNELAALRDDTEIVVFCNSEFGSDPIVQKLNDYGYRNVTHVNGGFIRWHAEALPVVADTSDAQ